MCGPNGCKYKQALEFCIFRVIGTNMYFQELTGLTFIDMLLLGYGVDSRWRRRKCGGGGKEEEKRWRRTYMRGGVGGGMCILSPCSRQADCTELVAPSNIISALRVFVVFVFVAGSILICLVHAAPGPPRPPQLLHKQPGSRPLYHLQVGN